MSNPHDIYFKESFSDPRNTAELLKQLLPADFQKHLDWENLQIYPNNFADQSGELRADLLFQCPILGSPQCLYIIFEHQSTPDSFMSVRMLNYTMRLWEDLRRNTPNLKGLPLVVPVVLHHGEAGWKAPINLQEILDYPTFLNPFAKKLVPKYHWILHDLAPKTNQHLLPVIQSSQAARLSVIQWALRDGRNDERFLQELPSWAPLLQTLNQSPEGLVGLSSFTSYILHLSQKLSHQDLIKKIRKISPTTANTMTSIAERLHEQGKLEGKLEGKLALLNKQFNLRFGALSPEQTSRLSQATEEELDRWAEQLFTAATIEELLN